MIIKSEEKKSYMWLEQQKSQLLRLYRHYGVTQPVPPVWQQQRPLNQLE